MIHFHPDRDGCDCDRRGLTNDDECLHADPCWISREAYAEVEHTAKQVPGLVALFDEATKELAKVEVERDRERDRAEAAEVNLGRERKAWGAAEHKISSLKHRLMSLEDAARRVRHGDHDYDLDVIRTDCILCAAIEGRYQPAWMEEPFEFLNDPIVKTPTPHLESASGLGYPRPPVVLPPADLVSWPWRLWRRQ